MHREAGTLRSLERAATEAQLPQPDAEDDVRTRDLVTSELRKEEPDDAHARPPPGGRVVDAAAMIEQRRTGVS